MHAASEQMPIHLSNRSSHDMKLTFAKILFHLKEATRTMIPKVPIGCGTQNSSQTLPQRHSRFGFHELPPVISPLRA